ncbi:hypothetical protein AVEN_9453-1 [Araneus ventricosus]|uniref:Integrase catalytic domain-containing protein n=1 Tax=Araneus ventricosus TaxID=182803 RepID=A0A4Y2FT31_ARAVE|nr:hypothetical protein AVEN_9453-1 [Araneus ventricosus]
MEEVFLRFELPRRVISDNGTQFVSAVMQQLCYLLKIHQSFIPIYHPEANPVERKSRVLLSRWKTNMTLGVKNSPPSDLPSVARLVKPS